MAESGAITHPEILAGLLEAIRWASPASQITVLENDGSSVEAHSLFGMLGIATVAGQFQATLLNAAEGHWVRRTVVGRYGRAVCLEGENSVRMGGPGIDLASIDRSGARTCPVCGAIDWRPWPIGSLLQCIGCRLVVDPCVWKGAAHAEEMGKRFFDDGFVDRIDRWQRLFEAMNNRRTWKRLCYRLSPRAKWMEIGVGSGSLLAYVQKREIRVSGCDPSRSVCEYVRARYGIEVFCGRIENMDRSATYDVVVMNHVLEHLANPMETLREVRARMAPTSWLHLAVPNVSSWEARLVGWTSYEPYHLLYFNLGSLGEALARAGFRVVEHQTVEPFSGWFLTIARTLLGGPNGWVWDRGGQWPAAQGWIRPLYRMLMVSAGMATTPARWLQTKLGFGEELVVIATPI